MTCPQKRRSWRASRAACRIPRDYNFAADILKRNLDAGRGDKLAFIDARRRVRYAALAERVERFGRVLRSLGIRREERILICLLDTIDWPTAFLGAIKAGVVAVPVNTLMTEDDYRFMLDDIRARAVGRVRRAFPQIRQAIGASADLAHVIVSGDNATSVIQRFDELLEPSATSRAASPRRRRATTCASGSTLRARPASRKAPCTPTPI